MPVNEMRPIHPGAILRERRAVTVDTAARPARYFRTTARFWMNLRADYGLKVPDRESGAGIAREATPLEAA